MKLYVGTYGKYNKGSLAGAWLDLDKFRNADEFEAACRRVHRDERDPEFMFQDVETDPGEDWQEGLYSESAMPRDYWALKAEARACRAKAEPEGAKAQREEQERLCAAFTTAREGYTREEHPEAWDRNFRHWKDGHYFVELSDGVILTVDRPRIKTRFCCGEDDRGQGGEDTPGTVAFAEKVLAEKRTERGFKAANLRPFDRRMGHLVGRRAWRLARDGGREAEAWRGDFVPGLMTGGYTDGSTYLSNAANAGGSERVVRILTDDDMRRLRRAYMAVRTDFRRRLNAYWKRFGASKIRTWTYWTEA